MSFSSMGNRDARRMGGVDNPFGSTWADGEIRDPNIGLTYTSSVSSTAQEFTMKKFLEAIEQVKREEAHEEIKRRRFPQEVAKVARLVREHRRKKGEHGWGPDEDWHVPALGRQTCICGHKVRDHSIDYTDERTFVGVAVMTYITSVVCTVEGCEDEYEDPWTP